ncbi:hypothetical protein M3667_01855 [Microbacterium sp. P26]|uniref:hypothetical protein n=1 Tax=Microbacterium TaxID=33882 RepID=UPI0020408A6A|nr:hypothetical protein [Microbacterium sp. P26]MCM3500622.1 hypothetical protein [Microbacterium sp. P26]
MTDDTRTGTAKGTGEYARRHPAKTKTGNGQQPTGDAAGRSAYERRHGARPRQNG